MATCCGDMRWFWKRSRPMLLRWQRTEIIRPEDSPMLIGKRQFQQITHFACISSPRAPLRATTIIAFTFPTPSLSTGSTSSSPLTILRHAAAAR